jgi:PAS domain S-box-containing protein
MTYHAETRDCQTISPQKMTFESFEHFFRALTIESGDGTIFAFQDLITVAANDRACDLYGLSQEEIRGRDIRTFFASGARSILDRALAELEDYQSWAGEVVGIRASRKNSRSISRSSASHWMIAS